MFSIGDFAKLGRVSVRMLRHYDAIGLLVPAEPSRPVGVVLVPRSSVGISDAIGGGLLDDALTGLAKLDEQQGRIVELRFFGGLATEEIAEVLGVSTSTVQRDWNVAKVWLMREMKRGDRDSGKLAKS